MNDINISFKRLVKIYKKEKDPLVAKGYFDIYKKQNPHINFTEFLLEFRATPIFINSVEMYIELLDFHYFDIDVVLCYFVNKDDALFRYSNAKNNINDTLTALSHMTNFNMKLLTCISFLNKNPGIKMHFLDEIKEKDKPLYDELTRKKRCCVIM